MSNDDEQAGTNPDVGAAQATSQEVARDAALNRPKRKAEVEPAAPTKRRSRRREAAGDREPRTTPVQFVRQSAGELRKVAWPTWAQLSQYFVVVLVFVLVVIAYVSGLDLLFGWGLFRLFG